MYGLYNTRSKDKSLLLDCVPTFPTIVKNDKLVWQGFKCDSDQYCKVDGLTPFQNVDHQHSRNVKYLSKARYMETPVGYGEVILPVPERFSQSSYAQVVDSLRVHNQLSPWDLLPISRRPAPYIPGPVNAGIVYPTDYQNFNRRLQILRPTMESLRVPSDLPPPQPVSYDS